MQLSAFQSCHSSDLLRGLLLSPQFKLGIISIPPPQVFHVTVAGGRPLGAALKLSGVQLVTEGVIHYFFCPLGE